MPGCSPTSTLNCLTYSSLSGRTNKPILQINMSFVYFTSADCIARMARRRIQAIVWFDTPFDSNWYWTVHADNFSLSRIYKTNTLVYQWIGRNLFVILLYIPIQGNLSDTISSKKFVRCDSRQWLCHCLIKMSAIYRVRFHRIQSR